MLLTFYLFFMIMTPGTEPVPSPLYWDTQSCETARKIMATPPNPVPTSPRCKAIHITISTREVTYK